MGNTERKSMKMSYGRFALMISAATVIMYGLMYLNVYALSHIEISQMRIWMAIVMGAVMAVVMLGFMWSMYASSKTNIVIVSCSVAVFAVALWLARSQTTVDDISYMRAMIPHHSIAILTSERAQIRDPRVRKLADEIIRAQVKEIEEMQQLIADLTKHPLAHDAPVLPGYRTFGWAPVKPH